MPLTTIDSNRNAIIGSIADGSPSPPTPPRAKPDFKVKGTTITKIMREEPSGAPACHRCARRSRLLCISWKTRICRSLRCHLRTGIRVIAGRSPLLGPKRGLLVLGHGWIMEVSKSSQTPTITEHANDTLSNESISTLLQNCRRPPTKYSLTPPPMRYYIFPAPRHHSLV